MLLTTVCPTRRLLTVIGSPVWLRGLGKVTVPIFVVEL